jgi:hypothetical protein
MDLIERWFHIAPDGGDGTFEACWIALAAAAVAAVALRHPIAAVVRSRLGSRWVLLAGGESPQSTDAEAQADA